MKWAIPLVILTACLPDRLDHCDRQAPGATTECVTGDWLDRSFELRVPSSWDGVTPLPTAVLLHGGGGNREVADKTTCPGGDTASPACFGAIALARGYAVVIPDGTGGRPLRGVRTWNAGGGGDGPDGELDCVSGQACAANVDDIAYIRDVLDEAARAVPIDPQRLYATGISNGGAMSHRLACELGDRFAAIASVAGGNQLALGGGACPGGAAVLEIHGTADPCWPYAGGGGSCIDGRYKASVDETMAAWLARNGCSDAFVDEAIPDRAADGVTSTRRRWIGCTHATELVTSDGAGHTWPDGYHYLDKAGVVTTDFGSELIVDFFDANPR